MFGWGEVIEVTRKNWIALLLIAWGILSQISVALFMGWITGIAWYWWIAINVASIAVGTSIGLLFRKSATQCQDSTDCRESRSSEQFGINNPFLSMAEAARQASC
jgi:hypothetical protein